MTEKRRKLEAAILYARSYFYRVRRWYVGFNGEEPELDMNSDNTNNERDEIYFDRHCDLRARPEDGDRWRTRQLHVQIRAQPSSPSETKPTLLSGYTNRPYQENANNSTQRSSAEKKSISQAHQNLRSTNPSPDCRVDEVLHFLRGCDPAMDHFLEAFIAFGCRNKQFLGTVAKLDDAEMDELLKRLLKHSTRFKASNAVPEMDLWILKRYFRQYFDTAPEA